MGMFVVAPATSFHHYSRGAGTYHEHPPSCNYNESNYMTADAATTLGVGVIPLLAAGPSATGDQDPIRRSRAAAAAASAMHPWQNQQQMGGSSSGVGIATCQDCGNQSKKDCSHQRCRTCCKSRGFDCTTHVRSTWVPASKRRERQMTSAATGTDVGGGGRGGSGGGASSGSTSEAKKPRLINSQTTSHTSTSNTPPRSFDASSSRQDVSFKETLPGKVRAPAVFKCVKVTAVEDGEDEFAYQAAVKIGGHMFKGFLYDQGVEPRVGFPNLSELHLGGGRDGGGGTNEATLLDQSEVYGASAGGGGLLGGSSYGNTIN